MTHKIPKTKPYGIKKPQQCCGNLLYLSKLYHNYSMLILSRMYSGGVSIFMNANNFFPKSFNEAPR